jgi:hypothetical protein
LSSSRIYYDPYDPENKSSNIGAGTKELDSSPKTPWIMTLEFSNKKLTTDTQFK